MTVFYKVRRATPKTHSHGYDPTIKYSDIEHTTFLAARRALAKQLKAIRYDIKRYKPSNTVTVSQLIESLKAFRVEDDTKGRGVSGLDVFKNGSLYCELAIVSFQRVE